MKETIEVNGLEKFTLYVGERAFVEYILTKLLRDVIKRLLLHNTCRKVKRIDVERFDRKEDKAEVLDILDFFPSLVFLSYKP